MLAEARWRISGVELSFSLLPINPKLSKISASEAPTKASREPHSCAAEHPKGACSLHSRARGPEEGNKASGNFREFGAQIDLVDEHPSQPSALLTFEYSCYPEAKILSSKELKALRQEFGDWNRVAMEIGASEAFARQNAQKGFKNQE